MFILPIGQKIQSDIHQSINQFSMNLGKIYKSSHGGLLASMGRNQPAAWLAPLVLGGWAPLWQVSVGGDWMRERGRMAHVLGKEVDLKEQRQYGMDWWGWPACYPGPQWCLGMGCFQGPWCGLWSWHICGSLSWCLWLLLPLRTL